jgi:hypothetical protein
LSNSRATDKTVALLQLLGGLGSGKSPASLYIVTVRTAEPDPVTFVMEGTKKALGPDIFEIPVDCYPLREGDRLLAFPLAGGQRWAVLTKLNGGVVMATMTGPTSLKPDGMTVEYGASRLIFPPYFPEDADENAPLKAGDRVSIAPTWDGDQVKYVILNRY